VVVALHRSGEENGPDVVVVGVSDDGAQRREPPPPPATANMEEELVVLSVLLLLRTGLVRIEEENKLTGIVSGVEGRLLAKIDS
jgi:hypothetical protein